MADELKQVSFSGHETFPLRYGWLKKGIDAVESQPNIFNDDNAMTLLGVGKNMVRSIKYWCLATKVLEEKEREGRVSNGLCVSKLGKSLFSDEGYDPFVEDIQTLWLIHWQLTSIQDRATTWYWAFSCIHENEFTKSSLLLALNRWIAVNGFKKASEATLERDIDCFLHSYASRKTNGAVVPEDSLDCPLAELRLIRQSDDLAVYSFNRGPQPTLPDGVVLFAVLDWWSRSSEGVQTLSLYDIAHAAGAPGRVFKLDEVSLVARLEKFEELTRGRIVYDETAGLKQLLRRESMTATEALRTAYRRTRQLAGRK